MGNWCYFTLLITTRGPPCGITNNLGFLLEFPPPSNVLSLEVDLRISGWNFTPIYPPFVAVKHYYPIDPITSRVFLLTPLTQWFSAIKKRGPTKKHPFVYNLPSRHILIGPFFSPRRPRYGRCHSTFLLCLGKALSNGRRRNFEEFMCRNKWIGFTVEDSPFWCRYFWPGWRKN